MARIEEQMPDPPEYSEYHVRGFDVVKNFGQIVAIRNSTREVRLGQRVTSNGRIVADGAIGIVVNLVEPYTNGRTTDVIEVWFEGNRSPSIVGLKDLRWS